MPRQQLIPLRIREQKRTPLNLAVFSFLLDAEARRLSPSTLKFYGEQLRAFLAHLEGQGVSAPEDIKPLYIRSYFVDIQRRGLSDSSQHAAARAIKAWCNFMVREEMLTASPMRKVQMPKMDTPILPAFVAVDVRSVLAACGTLRDKAIVLCLLDTGCRAAEFAALDVGDIDIQTGRVQVRAGKGGKGRVTFLGAKARKAVLKYLMERGNPSAAEPLWLSQKTRTRLTDWGLRQFLQRLGAHAGVEHCHPHTFRRTFVLWSLRSGMNIYALQQIMGHSDLQILRRYLALVEEDLNEAHRRHGAVDTML